MTLHISWTADAGSNLHCGVIRLAGVEVGTVSVFVREAKGVRFGIVHEVKRTAAHDFHRGAMSRAYSLIPDSLGVVALISSTTRTENGQEFWRKLRPEARFTIVTIRSKMAETIRDDSLLHDQPDAELQRAESFMLCADEAQSCLVAEAYFGRYGPFQAWTSGGRLDCEHLIYEIEQAEEEASLERMVEDYERNGERPISKSDTAQ